MMMRLRSLQIKSALCFGLLLLVLPWSSLEGGTNSLLFLQEGLSARAPGMGNAFVAVADDASATLINPAGLAQIKDPELVAMHKRELLDMNYSALGGALGALGGTLGFALTSFDGGVLDITELNGSTRQLSAEQDLALDMAYGHAVHEQVALGAGVKALQSRLAGVAGNAVALDLGVLAWTPFPVGQEHRLALGLSALNLGPGIDYGFGMNPLPLSVRSGLSYLYYYGPRESYRVSLESTWERNRSAAYAVGTEIIRGFFVGRLGLGEGDYSLGFGLRAQVHQLDYSFTPTLGQALHVISYSYHFIP